MSRLAFVVPGSPVPCARARVFADKHTGRVRSAIEVVIDRVVSP